MEYAVTIDFGSGLSSYAKWVVYSIDQKEYYKGIGMNDLVELLNGKMVYVFGGMTYCELLKWNIKVFNLRDIFDCTFDIVFDIVNDTKYTGEDDILIECKALIKIIKLLIHTSAYRLLVEKFRDSPEIL